MTAHFAPRRIARLTIGGGTSLFTDRGVLLSGVRQLLVGLAAAGVTYASAGSSARPSWDERGSRE